jgi:hypothetical protein
MSWSLRQAEASWFRRRPVAEVEAAGVAAVESEAALA